MTIAADVQTPQLEASFEKLTIDDTTSKSSTTSVDAAPISFSEEELTVMREVRKELLEKHKIDPERIGSKTLALTTIVSKLRVGEAAEKYAKYLQMVKDCGVPGLSDDILTSMNDNESELRNHLDAYAPCGRDEKGRSVMWIRGRKNVSEEEESGCVTAGIMYHLAVHADANSLHGGITFVVDTSEKPPKRAKNEQKLQKTWQSMPMRPQALMIAGASLPLRVIINSLILVASFFTKQKILDRIKFVTIQTAFNSIPKQSAPKYLGGDGGGIRDIVQWTKDRIDAFPVPNL